MEVVGRQLTLPESYGKPNRVLTWPEVEQKLVESKTYWLATTRHDGRPHSVPVDGIWLKGALYFGGDPATVHIRNLRSDPRAVVHTESGESPVIAEGTAEWYQPSPDEISRLVRGNEGEVWISGVPGVVQCRHLALVAWSGAGLECALSGRHPIHLRLSRSAPSECGLDDASPSGEFEG